jgi:hypothetical protein
MINKEKKEKKNEKRQGTFSIRMMNTPLEHAHREKTLVRIYRMCNTSLEGRRHIGREGLGPYEVGSVVRSMVGSERHESAARSRVQSGETRVWRRA